MPDGRRALVLGGGIAGLAAAAELGADLEHGPFDSVELWEADDRVGGKIRTSSFAGLAHVDEAADAYLLRVPHASALAARSGLTDIVHPAVATAAVWHGRLHDLPGGMVLGMPADLKPFATTSLLSWRGKLRALVEPLVPASDPDDSLGALVRHRFGDEVHERLVDALVGSIYAADTDHWSLASVPQLAALAQGHRSLLLAARGSRRNRAIHDGAPVFGTPRAGIGALVDATAQLAQHHGVAISTGRRVSELVRESDHGWVVDGERFDAVVLATPAAVTAQLLARTAGETAAELAEIGATDVVMVRLSVPQWPSRLEGRSGYLVPKPDQRHVTAVSFASQKWTHWRPPSGNQLLRVSLGRDGLPVGHLSDDQILEATLRDLGAHLEVDLQPDATSISRWAGAFPQYRPHHVDLVQRAERALPRGLALAGASYHGIGIPACIASGARAGRTVQESMSNADGFLT